MRVINLLIPIVILCLLFNFCSCNRDEESFFDKDGVAIKLPHLWKTSISNNNYLAEVSIATPIIYNENNFLLGGNKDGSRKIISLNSLDGKVNWEWGDLLSLWTDPTYKDPIEIVRKTYFQNNERLFFNYSTSSYCIDLATGQSLWKYKSFRSRTSNNTGIDNSYITSGANYEPLDDEKIYIGDLTSSAEEQLLLTPEYTLVDNPPTNAQGGLNSMKTFKSEGDTYLAFGIENPYTDFTNAGWGLTELNLYNITQSKYEYKKVVVNPNRETRGVGDLLYQAPNLYFQSSNYIHGVDAMTGEELWRTYLGTSPLTSRMILVDNKLFSACEDRFLYCVDITNGNMLWKEQNTGTCSELSYLNGVVYYLGGGDGLLHAVDAETGKHLWKVKSPDLGANSGAWFYGVCVAVPGKNGKKGVVVATTGLHAYGYEAIR